MLCSCYAVLCSCYTHAMLMLCSWYAHDMLMICYAMLMLCSCYAKHQHTSCNKLVPVMLCSANAMLCYADNNHKIDMNILKIHHQYQHHKHQYHHHHHLWVEELAVVNIKIIIIIGGLKGMWATFICFIIKVASVKILTRWQLPHHHHGRQNFLPSENPRRLVRVKIMINIMQGCGWVAMIFSFNWK